MSSRLYISCYRHSAIDDFNKSMPIPMTPPLSEAYVDIGIESNASEPFPGYTTFIEIISDVDCFIDFGVLPVAEVGYHPVFAGERLFYGTVAGQRIAVIMASPYIVDEPVELTGKPDVHDNGEINQK